MLWLVVYLAALAATIVGAIQVDAAEVTPVGPLVLMIAGILICAMAHFLQFPIPIWTLPVFLVSSACLLMYRVFAASAESTSLRGAGGAQYMRQTAALCMAALLMAGGAYYGIVRPLDPPTQELKLVTALRSMELMQVLGVYTTATVLDTDETSDETPDETEREEEQDILDAGYELESTVLNVGHHGSSSSTSYPFLREVMPQYGIISVGAGNSYGHPTDDTLSRLRDADVTVYRTDLQGMIHLTSDGQTVSISTEDAQVQVEQIGAMEFSIVSTEYNGKCYAVLAGYKSNGQIVSCRIIDVPLVPGENRVAFQQIPNADLLKLYLVDIRLNPVATQTSVIKNWVPSDNGESNQESPGSGVSQNHLALNAILW